MSRLWIWRLGVIVLGVLVGLWANVLWRTWGT